ncbi:MAG: thermonuclease family protein [Gaiellaceae bacterium]
MGPDRLRRAALIAVVVCAGCGGAAPPPVGVTVESVRDGDTILLEDGRRVRLVQVDAPELGRECYGDEAAAALSRLAPPGTTLRLERDPALDDLDRHRRLLRYAHVDATNLNLELVTIGAAAPYFYRGEQGRYARLLAAAAHAARVGRRGLWGACPRARIRPERQVETGSG